MRKIAEKKEKNHEVSALADLPGSRSHGTRDVGRRGGKERGREREGEGETDGGVERRTERASEREWVLIYVYYRTCSLAIECVLLL